MAHFTFFILMRNHQQIEIFNRERERMVVSYILCLWLGGVVAMALGLRSTG